MTFRSRKNTLQRGTMGFIGVIDLTILTVSLCLAALFFGDRAAASEAVRTSLKDFVHARELKTTLEGVLYRAPLPQFVYEGLRSQRQDLAVFNANGEIVPFVVRAIPPMEEISSQPDLPVPFYELPPDAKTGPQTQNSSPGALDVYVETGAGGRIVSVASGAEDSEPRDRRYLLDFSSIISTISAISATEGGNTEAHELRLLVPENVTLSAELSVFQSENLRDWSPLLENAPLIRLQNQNTRLASDRIALPHAPERYLLLRIRGAGTPFALKEIRYFSSLRHRVVREDFAFFEGSAAENIVEYDALGGFPASRINFVLQEPGLYKVRYFSRPDEASSWVPRGRAELSMMRNPVMGTPPVLSNSDIPIDLCEDRYWRVEFENAFSGATPKMKIVWRACELFFLAQGKAPYILAFGSSQKGLNLQNASLIRDGQPTALEAEIGPPVAPDKNLALTPGGEKAGLERNDGWQRYLVWGLLVLGSLILSAMAWKLMKS
ncbi:MAG: DUF3999 domain-containing protein [Synergistaceae bacterium]|jgi:hypothetical protein|nr:DUF3999 domain-containing protein [Synergistaceae bacterium]